MVVNRDILEQIPNGERKIRGKEYYSNRRAHIEMIMYENDNTYRINGRVRGNYFDTYYTEVLVKNGVIVEHDCDCFDHEKSRMCKHVIATLYEAIEPQSILPIKEKFVNNLTEIIEEEKREEEERLRIFREEEERREKQRQYEMRYYTMNSIISNLKDNKNNTDNNNLNIQKIYNEISQEKEYIAKYDNVENGTLELEPRIELEAGNKINVTFKIGVNKKYIIKDYSEFAKNYERHELTTFGKDLGVVLKEEKFTEGSKKYLDFILKYGKAIEYANNNGKQNYYYYSKVIGTKEIILEGKDKDEFLNLLVNKEIEVKCGGVKRKFKITSEQVLPRFYLTKNEENDDYKLTSNIPDMAVIDFSYKFAYIYDEEKMYKISVEGDENLRELLKNFEYNNEIFIAKDKIDEFTKVVLVPIKRYVNIEENSEEDFDILGVKVYLELDANDNFVANVRFCYGENEFNPLTTKTININRNFAEEKKVFEDFFRDGFQIDTNSEKLVLKDNDDMYVFLKFKIENYMKKYEVLASEEFGKQKVRKPTLSSVGIKVDNELLNIDMSRFDVNIEELKQVLQGYKLKKKYYRLKDGSFIDLQDNNDLDLVNDITTNLDINLNKVQDGVIKVPINRSIYLQNILNKNKSIEVAKDKKFTEIVDNISNKDLTEDIIIPKKMQDKLRDYQKTGYKWLKVIEHYNFGGILADDMGLRKNTSNYISY